MKELDSRQKTWGELSQENNPLYQIEIYCCRRHFCDKGQKCENGPNLPLGSLKVIICGESSPKFQMYNEQRLMVL